MAYHIYDTEAFVLDERPLGEANKIFYLLTPDLGLVTAQAQGVRLLKSKLRYQVAKYAHVRASLVRGKEAWRLIGAEKLMKLEDVLSHRSKAEQVAKIFSLLSKFIRGEGQQIALFKDLASALEFLISVPSGDKTALYGWELCLVLRLIDRLGYIEKDPDLSPIINFESWSAEALALGLAKEVKIIDSVNSATRASHF